MSAQFAAAAFREDDGPERLREILLEFVGWSDAVYATAYHSAQAHRRWGPGTPVEGLGRLDWLTYWGAPYVEMLGREHLLSAPCHLVEPRGTGILMQATPRFDSPPLVESTTLLLGLETYLGADIFAGPDYPRVPCRVPSFDMSETMCEPMPVRTPTLSNRGLSTVAPLPLPTAMIALAAEAETLAAADGVVLDYSPDSIRTVDAILEERRRMTSGRRDVATKAANGRLVSVFGAYVGEVLRRTCGARWQPDESTDRDRPALVLRRGDVTVFPMDRVAQRLAQGPAKGLDLFVKAALAPPRIGSAP